MFKIVFSHGSTVLTEKPTFICKHPKGCHVICDRKRAEGVAYAGGIFLFADGTQCYEFDGADELRTLYAENEKLKQQLADTDAAVIQMFESGLAQETINAEQDLAIIEIYETLGGIVNV